MEFTIDRVFLEHLLDKALTVPIKKDSLFPNLESFFLKLSGKELTVFRTNRELGVIVSTNVEAVEDSNPPLEVLIHAEKFSRLIKGLNCRTIRLQTSVEGGIEIEGGSYKSNWTPLDLTKFPSLVQVKVSGQELEVDAKEFLKVLGCVHYAAAKGSFLLSLQQIVFEEGCCWATDFQRYQMALTGLPKSFKLVFPSAALNLLRFISLTGCEKLKVIEDEKYYFFVSGKDTFFCMNSHILPADRGQILGLLDTETEGFFQVEIKYLLDVIKRLRITSEEGSNRISFEIKSDKLIISSEDQFGNSASEFLEITLQNKAKTRKKFGVNGEYLVQCLEAVKEDKTVTMRIDRNHVIFVGDKTYGVVPLLK